MKNASRGFGFMRLMSFMLVLALAGSQWKLAQASCSEIYREKVRKLKEDTEDCAMFSFLIVPIPIAIRCHVVKNHYKKAMNLIGEANVGFGPTIEQAFKKAASAFANIDEMTDIIRRADAHNFFCGGKLMTYKQIAESLKAGTLKQAVLEFTPAPVQ